MLSKVEDDVLELIGQLEEVDAYAMTIPMRLNPQTVAAHGGVFASFQQLSYRHCRLLAVLSQLELLLNVAVRY